MNHVHIHGRLRTIKDDENGTLFPAPQSFDDFEKPETDRDKANQQTDILAIRRDVELLYKNHRLGNRGPYL